MSPLQKHQMRENNKTPFSGDDIVIYAMMGDIAGVDKVLDIDPFQINACWPDTGVTPLIAASSRGQGAMVRHLLSKPYIDVDLQDNFGRDAMEHGRLFPEVVAAIVQYKFPRGANEQKPMPS